VLRFDLLSDTEISGNFTVLLKRKHTTKFVRKLINEGYDLTIFEDTSFKSIAVNPTNISVLAVQIRADVQFTFTFQPTGILPLFHNLILDRSAI